MDEKSEINTRRVTVNVDENATAHTRASVFSKMLMKGLLKKTKKLVLFPRKAESKKTKQDDSE